MHEGTLSWLTCLLGPVEAAKFLDQNWPYSSIISHASLDRFPELANAQEFASLKDLLATLSGPVRVWAVDSSGRFCDETLPPDSALARYEAGASTVVVDSLESRSNLSFLSRLLNGLACELATPQHAIACNAYASKAGTRTIPHFDEQEVFILQIRGEKRWLISPNDDTPFPTQHYNAGSGWVQDELLLLTDAPPQPRANSQTAVVLRPGSVLFLPRGYWHEGEAISDSLALTLTFYSASWLDLLLAVLRRRLILHEWLREPAVGALDEGTGGDGARIAAASAIDTLLAEARILSTEDMLRPKFAGMNSARRFFWAGSVVHIAVSDPSSAGRSLLTVQRKDLPDLQLDLPGFLRPRARWLATRSAAFSLPDFLGPDPRRRVEKAALLGLLLREEVIEDV